MRSGLPSSFDPYLMKDQLFEVLKNSPETVRIAPMRAMEIVTAIVQKPIIQNLQRDVLELSRRLEEEREGKEEITHTNKKYAKHFDKKLGEKENYINMLMEKVQINEENYFNEKERVKELEIYIREMEDKCKEMQDQIHALSEQINMISQSKKTSDEASKVNQIRKIEEINDLKDKINKIENLLKQKQYQLIKKSELSLQKDKNYRQEIEKIKNELNEQLNLKNKQIERLKQTKFEIKTQTSSLKSGYTQLMKENDNLKSKQDVLYDQYAKLKEQSQSERNAFDKQRKLLNQRLVDMSKHYKILQKIKSKLKNSIKIVRLLQEEKSDLKKQFQIEMIALKKEFQLKFTSALEFIGNKMQLQLNGIANQIEKKNQKIKLHKKQSSIKDQIINKLQRMLQNQSNGGIQLRNELRLKKKEEQKLKKQIKKAHHQTDLKLDILQQKYRQLILPSPSQYYT